MFSSSNNNDAVSNLTQPRSFIVGQDRAGRWIAVEPHGLAGGIFINRRAALAYATFEADHRSGAVFLTQEPIDLML